MKKLITLILPMALLLTLGCGFDGQPPEKGQHVAEIVTNYGTIYVKLYPNLVPETVKNFEELSVAGKYDGTTFHRVIKDFMIQGGDFENRDGTGGYSYKGLGTIIPDEFHKDLTNVKGALSMANRGPNTGSSQFFIVQAKDGTPYLDRKHAVFGYVYKGLKVVDKIASVKTDSSDKPVKDVTIKTIKISTY